MKTELQKELDSNIPESVVSTRSGGGGKELSYLETWYVIDRLNQVLGQGNWAYSSEVTSVHNGTTKTQYGESYTSHYIARVRLVVTLDERSTEFTDYGYGDGSDKNNPGKAHELAVKEAVSDGLKRAVKNLGRSMGLALYDKTQEYVGEYIKESNINSKREVDASTSSKTRGLDISNNSSSKIKITERDTGKEVTPGPAPKRPVKELVTAAFKVLEAQKKTTKEEFKEKYQKGKGISSLTDEELTSILKSVKQDFPHLSL